MNTQHLLTAAAIALFFAGCSDASGPSGSGDLQLSLAANEAVRVGFPHTENGQSLAFVDGWSVKIETFAVNIEQFELLEPSPEGEGPVAASWEESTTVNIAGTTTGSAPLATLAQVDEGRYDVRFRVAPPSATSTSEDAALLGVMRERGWSFVMRGTATPDGDHPEFSEPVSFDLGFPLEAEYYACVNGADGTQGVVVAANRQNEAYIYPHAVHLFWDTLGAGNEQLRFDAMARAATDGVVTMDALDQIDLTDPALADERGVPLYDDAGLLDTYTLGAFLRRAAAESLHFNGIGFCKKRFTR